MATNTIAELEALHEAYCHSAFNKEYYGRILKRFQRRNLIIEITLATTATGSGLSGLTLWEHENGKIAWGILMAITGFLALAKPFLQLHQRIEKYSKLFTGHLDNFLDLHRIVSSVERKGEYDEKAREAFELSFERYLQLSREDDPETDIKLRTVCETQIRNQFPSERLFGTVKQDPIPNASPPPLSVIETKVG